MRAPPRSRVLPLATPRGPDEIKRTIQCDQMLPSELFDNAKRDIGAQMRGAVPGVTHLTVNGVPVDGGKL
jgi:hypothetical protein